MRSLFKLRVLLSRADSGRKEMQDVPRPRASVRFNKSQFDSNFTCMSPGWDRNSWSEVGRLGTIL